MFKKFIGKVGHFLQHHDRIAPKISDEIHFNENDHYKTETGGFLSLLVSIFMAFLVTRNGYRMLINYQPLILSVERGLDTKMDEIATQRVNVSDVNLVWFELFDHKFNRFTLEEARPYIEFNTVMIHKIMEPLTGKYVQSKKYYDMQQCQPE